jgi:predicted  nucleic acid-binding Zn-ribbon protein
MPTVTETLRECHRLRRLLRDLQAEIDRGPRVLAEKQAWLAEEKALHQEAHDAIKRLKLKQKDDEGTLRQIDQQIAKLADRAMTVTTMKEMEATKHETEMAQVKKGECEDAILASIMEIETRVANLPADDRRWAEAQAEFQQFEADAKERFERIVEEQAISSGKLIARDAELPADVKPLYERLVKSHGPDGLAAVKAKVCQNCRAALTEQQLINLQASRFMTCPRCGRALYPE